MVSRVSGSSGPELFSGRHGDMVRDMPVPRWSKAMTSATSRSAMNREKRGPRAVCMPEPPGPPAR